MAQQHKLLDAPSYYARLGDLSYEEVNLGLHRIGQHAFIFTALTVHHMHESGKYSKDNGGPYASIEEWGQEEFRWKRTHINCYSDAGHIIKILISVRNLRTLPSRESHLRPLYPYKNDMDFVVEAWNTVIERSGKKKITSALVDEVVEEMTTMPIEDAEVVEVKEEDMTEKVRSMLSPQAYKKLLSLNPSEKQMKIMLSDTPEFIAELNEYLPQTGAKNFTNVRTIVNKRLRKSKATQPPPDPSRQVLEPYDGNAFLPCHEHDDPFPQKMVKLQADQLESWLEEEEPNHMGKKNYSALEKGDLEKYSKSFHENAFLEKEFAWARFAFQSVLQTRYYFAEVPKSDREKAKSYFMDLLKCTTTLAMEQVLYRHLTYSNYRDSDGFYNHELNKVIIDITPTEGMVVVIRNRIYTFQNNSWNYKKIK